MNNEHPLTELKGLYTGQDIFVLGSGSSMDYFTPGFFRDRITIGCNYVYRDFPVMYTVAKELPEEDMREASRRGAIPVISRYRHGDYTKLITRDVPEQHYVFEHRPNMITAIDWTVLGTDQLVVSWSTITSTIHLAAYMGARTIFLCGVDAGTLDGQANYTNYAGVTLTGQSGWYIGFLQAIRLQTAQLRDMLLVTYGCQVLTLSPFTNLGHEGHVFAP